MTGFGPHQAPRIGWGIADQALSSVLNLVVGLLIARAVSASGFGTFALALSTYLLVVGLCRALVAEPMLIRASDRSAAEWRLAARAATGASLVVGAFCGSISIATGALAGGQLGAAFVALGLVLPVLLLQDMWRYAFFAAGRGRQALITDFAYVAVLLPSLGALSAGHVRTIGWFVVTWGLAALPATVVGGAFARTVPDLRAAPGWIRSQKDLALPFAGEFVAVSAGELALFGIGGLVGLRAVGALRGGQILLGPVRVLLLGVRLVAIPEGVHTLRRSESELTRMCVSLSALLVTAAFAWAGALLLMPDRLGEAVLGPTWSQANATLLPLGLALAGTCAMTGAFVGLRALEAAKRSLRSRLALVPFVIGGGLAGAALGGAPGAAWGTAAVVWSSVGLWWWQFRAQLATGRATPDLEPAMRGAS
jgi:hypothetical protein